MMQRAPMTAAMAIAPALTHAHDVGRGGSDGCARCNIDWLGGGAVVFMTLPRNEYWSNSARHGGADRCVAIWVGMVVLTLGSCFRISVVCKLVNIVLACGSARCNVQYGAVMLHGQVQFAGATGERYPSRSWC